MCVRKRSDGHIKVVEGSDSGEVKPLRVDELGQIILST